MKKLAHESFRKFASAPNWRKAHNVLLPAFSMDAMRGYYPRMLDVAVQLMQKRERPTRRGPRAHMANDCKCQRRRFDPL